MLKENLADWEHHWGIFLKIQIPNSSPHQEEALDVAPRQFSWDLPQLGTAERHLLYHPINFSDNTTSKKPLMLSLSLAMECGGLALEPLWCNVIISPVVLFSLCLGSQEFLFCLNPFR